MSVQIIDSKKAAALIEDGVCVALDGCLGTDVAEEILEDMKERFQKTGHPKNLDVWYGCGIGDNHGSAVENFAEKGMLKRVVGGLWSLAPKLAPMVANNDFEAFNFPQGTISQLFRDAAAHRPVLVTHTGLGTFVDPENDGGRLNEAAKNSTLVNRIKIHGKDYLAYETPKPDVAIFRGTYADENGNITFDDEPLTMDVTAIAMAAHNNGGKVIVQVKRIVRNGSLDPKAVKVPGVLVDYVVPTDNPEMTKQTNEFVYNPDIIKSNIIKDADSFDLPLDKKKIIARRAAFIFNPDTDHCVNFGIGQYPMYCAMVMKEEGLSDNIVTTVEAGTFGGTSLGGPNFGTAIAPQATIDEPYMFDFYNGGGLDITYLGLAEADEKGNLNVSKFGPKIAGTGGFVDITQYTPKIVFTGTFTAAGLKEEIKDGKLHIIQEGKVKKFVKNVQQITFSGKVAYDSNQEVWYVTERAVFKLVKDGLELVEIAPGIDLQKDILDQMEFKPIISDNLKEMDSRIFEEPIMNIKD
ncbi:malonate decarboxylase subunit alpha [Lactobacillus sp. LL6]|uniref:acyl CoA:acetate/3-ketoacid CoA transferase n=1 Tax=Lactobacillus sp. LL6 TaxID=2596827 RepID=UPI0011864751|nr:malonate decarboxylase subunit alpha [Lactobacillus sp. LL6]TSO25389.1 3-oxoacid CoA-transferase [Lactobacillus sp. LL6]